MDNKFEVARSEVISSINESDYNSMLNTLHTRRPGIEICSAIFKTGDGLALEQVVMYGPDYLKERAVDLLISLHVQRFSYRKSIGADTVEQYGV